MTAKEAVAETTEAQMNNTMPNSENRGFKSFSARPTAEARDLHRTLFLSAVAATAIAIAALVGTGSSAAMQLNTAAEKSPRVLSYADPMPERFGAFDMFDSGYSDGAYAGDIDHELNDAWMGMTVVSADGVIVGYVTDAFINADGSLDEIVIAPSGEKTGPSTSVYVPAKFAELGTQNVHVSLDARIIAQLEPATDLAMLGE